MTKRHRVATVRTVGLFAAGSGASCAVVLYGVAATGFLQPAALYHTTALGAAGLSLLGVLALCGALAVQRRADAARRNC